MKSNKLIIVCLLTLMVFIFNVILHSKKHSEQTIVNLSIFFFVSIYGYLVYDIFTSALKLYNKFEKNILNAFGWFWCIPILLNLISINQNWNVYNNITSNRIIDLFSAIFLITILILLLCQKLGVMRF